MDVNATHQNEIVKPIKKKSEVVNQLTTNILLLFTVFDLRSLQCNTCLSI